MRLAGKVTMLRLCAGHAQRRGKGLIDFVIGQTFGFARVLRLLGSNSERRETLGRLPGPKIDEGFLNIAKTSNLTPPREKCERRHGVARGPRECHAHGQKSDQCKQNDEMDAAKDTLAGATDRNGRIGESRHRSIVAGQTRFGPKIGFRIFFPSRGCDR